MKPNEVKTLKAKKTWFLLPSFKGMMWKGIVYCRKQEDIDVINKSDVIDSDFKSHETIHIRQALSMKNSWFRFYMNYIWNYLKNLPLLFVNTMAPYMLIPTEIEAYVYSSDFKYAEKNEPVTQWKVYSELKLKEKRQIAKNFFKATEKKRFSTVVKEFMKNRN